MKNNNTDQKFMISLNKGLMLLFTLLCSILFGCGILIIHWHGPIGFISGCLFLILSTFIAPLFVKGLFSPMIIGWFDKNGYEDNRLKIRIPWEDFEILFSPSPRMTRVGIEILEFDKYSDRISVREKEKCLKNFSSGNGHIIFDPLINESVEDLMNFINDLEV